MDVLREPVIELASLVLAAAATAVAQRARRRGRELRERVDELEVREADRPSKS